MSSNRPLVSVCIPVYNGKKYIDETIQSILAQTYCHIEIIIQDNASTDGTWELLQEYAAKYPQIFIERNIQNYGMTANWNLVINRARGDYAMLLSADDTLGCEFLTRCLTMFACDDFDILTTNHYYLREGKCMPRPKLVSPGLHVNFSHTVLLYNPFSINFSLFSKSALQRLSRDGKLFPRQLLTCDYDLWFRVALGGLRVCYLNEHLASYRIHNDNLSLQRSRMLRHAALVILSHKRGLKITAYFAYRLTLLRFLYRYVRLAARKKYDQRMIRALWGELWR